MKVKISLYAALFLAIGSCIAPFLDIPTRENGANSEKVEVQTVASTNSVPFSTNLSERANMPDLDWFKNGSNYIWDDWKIK